MEPLITRPPNEAGEKTLVRDLSWCGVFNGANASMVDVKDGKIIRIRPARYYDQYTREEVKPWVMHARGQTFEPSDKSLIPPLSLAYKKRVFSPGRIRYPMKRVDFDPKGERNPQNRGVSKYERISWDEALDIIASEMVRVKETYGPTAILNQSDQHGENKCVHGPHGCMRNLLKLFGGYTLQVRDPDSWEGWWWGAKHVWGCEPVGQQMPQKNIIYDIAKNTELLLHWGCDLETTVWGWQGQLTSRLSFWWSDLGIKQIFIAPDVNYANAIHADKWIPILPNTDAALYLAIAHEWFENGTYDKAYLETHAYGVDKFEDYVMGREDGQPKSPEWASPITGIPARIIRALAKEWASKRTTILIGNGGPGIRGPYATEPARLQVLCLAMQGLGKPGCNQSKMIEWGLLDDYEQMSPPAPSILTNLYEAYRGSTPMETCHPSFIPKSLIPKALLEGHVEWFGNEHEMAHRTDQFVHYTYPAEGCSKIHMIWTDSPSWITCWNAGNDFVKAVRQPDIEFMLAQHPWLENDCLFADIILPINTKLEEDDIGSDIFSGQMNLLFPEERCVEPLGESVSDYEAVVLIAERLGLLEEYTGGKTIPELIKIGYETSRVADSISWDDLRRKGLLRGPAHAGLGGYPGRPDRILRGPREAPALHAHRQDRVLRHRPRRQLPRRRGAAAGAQVDPARCVSPRDHRDRTEQEVSAAGHEQPPALGGALPARRRHLVPGDRHLQSQGTGRLSVPAAVDEPGGRGRAGDQARRRGGHLQRAGDGAGRGLCYPAHHGRGCRYRPRRQVRPHRSGGHRPGRGHQYHRPA